MILLFIVIVVDWLLVFFCSRSISILMSLILVCMSSLVGTVVVVFVVGVSIS